MPESQYTVLFADIAGSMQLYQSAGDERAKSLIVGLQSELTAFIQSCHGTVQDIIGDEIMARFDDVDSALQCASAIHRKTESYGQLHSTPLQMRIGLNTGAAIVEQQRMFGDTVNLAARVAAIATAGQTIITAATLAGAGSCWQTTARQFDVAKVKGKTKPVVVYLLPWREQDLTIINTSASAGSSTAGTLELHYADKTLELEAHEGTFSIGRAVTNDLVVDAEPVSRRHTTIECVRERYVIADNSTNGTHVYLDSGEVIYLRREQLPVWGTGELALGAPSDQARGHVIRFAVNARD
ncbi:MAG: adenylate/guanylate cyclase domain-containing protein [Gammaproteobacteria bacterium]|nr:adenylate/guanylate cyclase domain-containing protein [Gammaproteobacteria bacterium]